MPEDIIGKRFGFLTVIKLSEKSVSLCICKCDCGTVKELKKSNLKFNGTKSCGCYAKSIYGKFATTHGLSKTRIYKTWASMRQRGTGSDTNKKYYSNRGIGICEEWKTSFIEFYNWAIINGYKENLQIDRIDNNKGYCPENCRFVTAKENSRNRRSNILIEIDGVSKTLKEWAEFYNLNPKTVYTRYNRKYDLNKLFEKVKE